MNFITVYHSKAATAQLAADNMTDNIKRTIFLKNIILKYCFIECMRLRSRTKTANKASNFL